MIRSFITESEQVDGHRIVNGRPHGFNFKKVYTLNIEFESREEAEHLSFYLNENTQAIKNPCNEGKQGSGES